MLYPTHMRTAVTFGAIASSIMLFKNDPAMSALTVMGGSIVGGRIPDCDSPSSIPSKRYPWLSKLDSILGIKHRGHISHGWVFNTLFWLGIWYFLWSYQPLGENSLTFGFFLAIFGLTFSLNQFYYFLYEYIFSIPYNPANFIQYLFLDADRLTTSAMNGANYRPKLKPFNKIHSLIVCLIIAVLIAFLYRNNAEQIGADYFLGIYVGVLSHLFADSLTKAGTGSGKNKIHILGGFSKYVKTGTNIELWFRSFFTITAGLGIAIVVMLMIANIGHGLM